LSNLFIPTTGNQGRTSVPGKPNKNPFNLGLAEIPEKNLHMMLMGH
jgi:hypothetical protein